MGVSDRQIGWSQESVLLQGVSKQLERFGTLINSVNSTVVSNSTTTVLTNSILNNTYPITNLGFRVICVYIATGPLIYTKTSTGGCSSSVTITT